MEGADRKAKGTSDLGVRTASAIVMVVVAGTAFWLGGWAWVVFVGVVATVVLWEWRALVRGFGSRPLRATAWDMGGVIYIGFAAAFLMFLRDNSPAAVPALVGAVIATDVGAYFAGRTFGGPKISPAISPSKTWAGLIGGMAASASFLTLLEHRLDRDLSTDGLTAYALAGALFAVVAQVGDFFESWMKRRAGVKDSGKLIPGHGGLYDRIDGLLAVVVAYALFYLIVEAGRR